MRSKCEVVRIKQSMAVRDSIEVYERLQQIDEDNPSQPLCDEFFSFKFNTALLQSVAFNCDGCPWLKFFYNTPCSCELWLKMNFPMLGAMQGFESLQSPEYDKIELESQLKEALLHWADFTLEQPNIFRLRLEANAGNHPLVTEYATEQEREESLSLVFTSTLNECLVEVSRERKDCLTRLINMFTQWAELLQN